jgi:hypothetical protein
VGLPVAYHERRGLGRLRARAVSVVNNEIDGIFNPLRDARRIEPAAYGGSSEFQGLFGRGFRAEPPVLLPPLILSQYQAGGTFVPPALLMHDRADYSAAVSSVRRAFSFHSVR